MTQSIIPFDFHSHAVRVVMRDGNPWFVATDVAVALGYRDAANAARHVGAHQKGTHIVSTIKGNQSLTIVSEGGLYRLVLRSRRAEAVAFSDWVTDEVLPSIRKTGGYSASHPPAVTLTEVEAFNLYALLRMVAGHLSRERIEPIGQALHLMRSPFASAVNDLWLEVGPRAKRMEDIAERCRSAFYGLR
ncbi:prophage antirepressor [Xylella fastidiosa Mul-MD]|uniref:BRO-N domain-containing protein n=1 Tax=Xylella fastidiosa TaxID=2371 RepID=UPI0003ECF6FC|nr:Bro-N domain-containing protein [Xylella fastidiosa]EWG13407.1 prophage antirepressor [Xylella fastidiosa Mul-MD]